MSESYDQKQHGTAKQNLRIFFKHYKRPHIYHVLNKTDQNLTPYSHIHIDLKSLNPPYIWKSFKLWHLLPSNPNYILMYHATDIAYVIRACISIILKNHFQH